MMMMVLTAAFLVLVGFGVHASRNGEQEVASMSSYTRSEYRVVYPH